MNNDDPTCSCTMDSEKYRMLLDNMCSCVAVYKAVDEGKDFVFVDFNKAAETVEGLGRDKVIDHRITEIFPGVSKFGLLDVLQRVYSSGKQEYHPAGVYKDDQRVGWRENYVYRLPSMEVVTIYEDVSEKKKMAEKLNSFLKDLKRLKSIVDGSPAVAVEWVFRNGEPSVDFVSEGIMQFGYSRDYLMSRNHEWSDIVHPDDVKGNSELMMGHIKNGNDCFDHSYRIVAPGGVVRWVNERVSIIRDDDGKPAHIQGIVLDITDAKDAMKRQELFAAILDVLNQSSDQTDMVRKIVRMIKNSLGVDAVAIRLRNGDDYPYYYSEGFPDAFVRCENSLLQHDNCGSVVVNKNGEAVLECMCGKVINDAHKSNNEHPSFWTNSTTDLMKVTGDIPNCVNIRNHCNKAGYESVALIPFFSGGKRIGLLQINDKQRNRFNNESISFLESLGESIGIAIAKKELNSLISDHRASLSKANQILSLQSEITRNLLSSSSDANDIVAEVGKKLKLLDVRIYQHGKQMTLISYWNPNSYIPKVMDQEMNEVVDVREWTSKMEPYVGLKDKLPNFLSFLGDIQPEKLVAMPVCAMGKPLCITAFGYSNGRQWTPEELDALSCMSGLLSLMAVNQRSHDKVMTRLREKFLEINNVIEKVGVQNA